jgi:integrase
VKRTTVAKGIYRDAYGYQLRWRDRGVPRQKRFPLDTPLDHLKEFRKARLQRAKQQRELHGNGSFVRDAVRFLKTRRRLPSFEADRSHLRPWIHRFRRMSRWAVTPDQVRRALQEWAALGYSTRTLRHRLRMLRALYQALDPGVVDIPTAGVKAPKGKPSPIQRRPRQLRLQEMPGIGRLRDAKTRARFLVLATTGMRPAQLKRALALDISLDERLWIVQPAKGDKGTVIYLNDDMLRATQLFIAAKAWGWFDGRSFVKTLHRNGWPKGLRVYNVRHAVGQTLRRRGAELGDVADHLGHRSLATTRQFYVEPELARLKATSQLLDGRIAADAFEPPLAQRTGTRARKQNAKDRENTRHFAPAPNSASAANDQAKSKK